MKLLAPICLLALAACAKGARTHGQASRATGTGSRDALAALATTEAFDESTLLAAAATVVREAAEMPAASALRCARGESRERVREACLLAWSVHGEASAELEALLRDRLPSASRAMALAAARREGFASTLSPAEIGVLLRRIPEPAWARAVALRAWANANTVPPHLAGSLWNALDLPRNPDPLTLGAAASIASRFGGGLLGQLREGYCPEHVSGIALTRCFRFASALVDPRSGSLSPAMPLPSRRDPVWPLFATAFPERARLLENHH